MNRKLIFPLTDSSEKWASISGKAMVIRVVIRVVIYGTIQFT